MVPFGKPLGPSDGDCFHIRRSGNVGIYTAVVLANDARMGKRLIALYSHLLLHVHSYVSTRLAMDELVDLISMTPENSEEEVSWWNRNIPVHERALNFPDSLMNITERRKALIGQFDTDHNLMFWQEVKDCIGMSFVITLTTFLKLEMNRLELEPIIFADYPQSFVDTRLSCIRRLKSTSL